MSHLSHRARRRTVVVLLSLVASVVLLFSATTTATGGPRSHVRIDWEPCPQAPQSECGTLQVPVDWSRPHGPRISVAVARHRATDPSRRIGTLFYNPGGPGDGAAQYVANPETFFSAELIARFDLVGMDPRGIGGSTPIRCGLPAITATTTLFPHNEAEFDALTAHNRALGQSCLEQTGELLRHADTISVARDHEALRRALHAKTVSWFGVSYGTQVAANYAELFPGRTRAMALDAPLEHSLPEVHQLSGEILAAEDSFNRFADWCPTTDACALRGRDVRRTFDDLVARADREPIPVPGAIRPVTGEDIRMGTKGLLRFKEASIYGPQLSWAGLSQALQNALNGDASAFATGVAGAEQTGLFGLLGNACLDYVPQVHTWAQMQQRLELGRQLAPHLQGAAETWQALLCIDWPVPATNPPRALQVRGVPALLVHAVHDPSDAYSWAHGLAAQIEGSQLLTRTGDGHTSYHTSPCAQSAMDRFLVRPDEEDANRVCNE